MSQQQQLNSCGLVLHDQVQFVLIVIQNKSVRDKIFYVVSNKKDLCIKSCIDQPKSLPTNSGKTSTLSFSFSSFKKINHADLKTVVIE